MLALVDCNSFYCSCERAFNPKLYAGGLGLGHIPVVVLSNNDGCVISRSNEAKAIGILMGAPAHLIRGLVEKHKVAVFSSNYALYGDMSARVMSTLAGFAPDIEIYSIDEAFLNLTGFEHLDLRDYGSTIIRTTQKHTGIPVSIGISHTKTLAKLANKLAKKQGENRGVCVLDTEESILYALKNFPIDDVWGIGRQHAKRLRAMNINTAYDFTQLSPQWVDSNMTVVGLRIWEELRGKPCYELESANSVSASNPVSKKSICTSRSFGSLIVNITEIEEALANHAATCAMKLRHQHSNAGIISIFITTNRFKVGSPQYSNSINLNLPYPTNNTSDLIKWAKYGLQQIFRTGYEYKKVGIIANDLSPEDAVQYDLFRNQDADAKAQKLMVALDKINRAMGRNTVKTAAQGMGGKWKLRQEKLSPCYTTRLKDILVVSG
jgi:DNA polymerase V